MPDSLFRTKAPGIMYQLIQDFDLQPLDAAAILGNIGEECAGFMTMQEIHPVAPGSAGGYGWCQWTGPRRKDFEAYCTRNKFDPASDQANYGFMFMELKGSEAGAIKKLKAAGPTLSEKVITFERAYLRAGTPHYPERINWANSALNAFNASAHVDAVKAANTPQPTKEREMSNVLPSANHVVLPSAASSDTTVIAGTQSPAASTTNWALILGIASSVFGMFHINIPHDLVSEVALGIPVVTSLFAIIRKTYFTNKITTTALPSKK